MKILELRSENVKRLVAVQIRPGEEPVVEITGENGAGKSSVLDSIVYALGGAETMPPEVIRRGEENATVELDLGDSTVDYTVRRRTTASGSTLVVQSKDGARYPSPQALLDTFIGKLSFDPLAFIEMKPDKQQETVKKLVNVDTSAIEADYAKAYAERTKINAEGKSMKARFEAMPVPTADTPDEALSIDELLDEQGKLQAEKEANDKQRAELARRELAQQTAEAAFRSEGAVVERLEKELEEARTKEAVAQEADREAQEAIDEIEEEVLNLIDPDVSEVVRRISRADATNQRVREKKAWAALGKELDAKRKEAEAADEKVTGLESKKTKMISEAKFPIAGMSFSTTGLTFNGLPLEQASMAEKLRVGVAMGFAINPKLKVVLIHDGSLLDGKNMKLLGELATAAGAQVWIERVGSGKVGFEIVEGYVVSRDGVPVERPAPELTETIAPPAAAPSPPKTALSIVPPPPKTPPKPAKVEKPSGKVPTFKKRPIPDLSADELAAAMEEVKKAIANDPLSAKSTQNRAKFEDLLNEQNRRLDNAIDGGVEAAPEPGSDG